MNQSTSRAEIYGICQVKNEDDIIAESLTYALRFCSKIFVIDNCSTDKTWTVIQTLAKQHPQIIPWLQTEEPYTEAMRARVYNQYRAELSENDWWMVVDSDEFLAEDPHAVIRQAAQEKADLIRSWQIHFYFTDCDYEKWLQGRESRDSPIYVRRRYYLINWQETRLFRNQTCREWDASINKFFPNGLRRTCKHYILNRHYQFRDPEQIQKRLSLRLGHPSFTHVKSADWRSVMVPSKRLNYYNDGEPWRFSVFGLAQYYQFVLRGTYQAGVRRLRRMLAVN